MPIALEEQIGPLLLARGLKLCTAESCTGGLIGDRITNIPGSSEYFLGSVVSYAYEAKELLLGVRHDTLMHHGAVSRETVLSMAVGVRLALASDFGMEHLISIAVTGIAGPSGGMPGKPVGLVWIGLSSLQGDHAWRFFETGNRVENKAESAQLALTLLMEYLTGCLRPEEEAG